MSAGHALTTRGVVCGAVVKALLSSSEAAGAYDFADCKAMHRYRRVELCADSRRPGRARRGIRMVSPDSIPRVLSAIAIPGSIPLRVLGHPSRGVGGCGEEAVIHLCPQAKEATEPRQALGIYASAFAEEVPPVEKQLHDLRLALSVPA